MVFVVVHNFLERLFSLNLETRLKEGCFIPCTDVVFFVECSAVIVVLSVLVSLVILVILTQILDGSFSGRSIGNSGSVDGS